MKTLLVDDHPLILSALSQVLDGLDAGCDIVTASSARQARDTLADDPGFDLVLLDLHLGDADGFELLVELRRAHPELPVIVISASERPADVTRAIDLGAMGFVPKRASQQLLLDALRLVLAGGIYVPPMALRGSAGATQDAAAVPLAHDLPAPETLGLTPRQGQVLGLLLQGLSNKLIARELGLSVETVKDHMAAVLRALGVSSRTQAALEGGRIVGAHGLPGGWKRPQP